MKLATVHQRCVMADLCGGALLFAGSDQMHSRNTTRDVNVIPGVFDFDLIKLRTFDITNRKYTLMQSAFDCRQVMPICSIRGYDRTVAPQPDCSTG